MQRRAVTFQNATSALLLAVCLTTAPWVFAGEQPQKAANSKKESQKSRSQSSLPAVEARTTDLPPSNSDKGTPAQEVQLLKQQLAAQQAQIEQLRVALQEQRTMLERALQFSQPATERSPSLGEVASVKPVVPAPREALLASANAVPGRVPSAPQNGGAANVPAAELEIVRGELEAVADSANQTNQRVAKLEASVADGNKQIAAKFRGLGNFNFSGDVRLRYEPFFQDGSPTRQRERARARLNLTGKLSDELAGGVSIATGALDDVNSTNQSLTGFFTRKTVGFDKYFLVYKPKWFKQLALTGGKFTYPWYRTPLTFDNDLNPEGFAQTLSFDIKNPVLKNITLVGFELPFNEASGAYDSFIFGAQLQTRWKLSEKAGLGLYASGVNFNRADPIAAAIAGGTLRPSLANSNTYRTVIGADGKPVVVGYASKFAYLDLIGQFDYKWSGRWPMMLMFNSVNNTRGATQQRSAYWAEIAFGQLREAKDVQFGYSYIWIEKDAVIGAFNESDLRSSTNVKNHRLLLGYQGFNNVTFQWTTWLGKLNDPFQNTSLVPSALRSGCTTAPFTDCHDSLLNRIQFDLIYKF